MKNIPVLFFIFLLCALNSLAQTAASTPTTIVSELSELQTDYDPASGVSPLTLLAAPKDGVTYYETKLQARRLYEEKKYSEAEPLLERLVREYPRDPENWRMLADTKKNLKKPLEAVPAYEQAGKIIGWYHELKNNY